VPRSVLILFAHPAYHRSRANRALVDAVQGLEGVTFHDLYESYPDLMVDVPREQELLAEHDAVVAQHPFYWYSAPALIKEWIDLVLTHGWAYGEGGTALTGKTWLSAITSGGSEDSYGPSGGNRFSVAEFMRPFEATVALCHMRWLEPFVVHASHLVSQTELADAALSYRERILALQRDG
jgi:glutathione-regulated potassium-efflux system ancillary protein KefG